VQGATFTVGQSVTAAYSCADAGGPGIASCTGPVANGAAINTATAGAHTFTVTATSHDGVTGMASATYTVAAPPSVSIASPASGATFTAGQSVTAAFSCADGVGGPGIAACVGPVADGAPIDTTTVGPHTFTVAATSADGQTQTVSNVYMVQAPVIAPPAPPVISPVAPPVVSPVAPPVPASTVPLLSGLKGLPARWRLGKALPRISGQARPAAAATGMTFSFSLSVAARLELMFAETSAGRLAKGRCVASTARTVRRRSCVRLRPAGTVSLTAPGGKDEIAFDGRLSAARSLKPGPYTVTFTATDTAGGSQPRSVKFTIVR
jgi:hypothetical protein